MGGMSQGTATSVANYGKNWGEKETRQYASDPEAAKRLADIADRQMVMAEEAWGVYKTDFLPYEKANILAQTELIDPKKEFMTAGLEQATKEMGLAEPATEKFYKEAVEGVSAEEARGKASADVEQTYGQGLKEARRDLARAGVSPGSKKYQEMMSDMIYQKAKAGAGARTRATRYAGEESFRRLGAAMAVRGRPTAQGLAQPTGGAGRMAGGLMGGASATSTAGLRPQKTTEDYTQRQWGTSGQMQYTYGGGG